MKKLLLSLTLLASTYWSSAQVIVAGVSPASIIANYTNSWADPAGGWGTPDFNTPGVYVQDTLMIVEDGSTGTNPQGFPISQEGCNPLINDLTGKIAVIYRNTCEFGAKAFNAQNAGAVGVIIINRDPEVIQMGAGADGANVTIPVVMLTTADGAALVAEMANGPVVVFMGNKTGLFANDIALLASNVLTPKLGGVPALLAQNGTEFSFDLGARIYNPGSLDQTNITINAKVTNPTGNVVYDNSVSGLAIVSNDSIDVDPLSANALPLFSLATYPAGKYTLTYTISLNGVADEYDGDNTLSSTFTINDSIYSFAQIDATTNAPNPGSYYRPSTNNQTFSICNVINDPHASRVAITGIYFAATNSTATLEGEEIALFVYKWEDAFTDLNDAGFGFNTLTEVGSGYYYFPNDGQDSVVYGALPAPVPLTDNQRYLVCAQTANTSVFLGHESNTNYSYNFNYYAQPMFPNESDGTYYAAGFGGDNPNSLGIKVIDAANLGVKDINEVAGMAYPNPATDKVTVSIEGSGVATLKVTDVAGKVAIANTVSLVNGKAEVNIASLEAGMYIFNVVLENGKTSQFNVVKK